MKTYPLFKVHIPKEAALEAINEVFESGYINEGTQVTELTNRLHKTLGCIDDSLILTNSATSALTLALKLSGVGHNDEVVSTPMTCVATNTPIKNLGAKVVWADVIPTTGMLDPEDVVRKITDKTKAVMVVAWAGNAPELEKLSKICAERGVKLILDAAHAFGASYHGRPIHTWADYTCYSFQAIKHFTTGDGGALVCRSYSDHLRSKALKWFGLDRDKTKDEKGDWKGQQWDTDVAEAGYKFNMNNVAAAIGLSQLRWIDDILRKHRFHGELYDELFNGQSRVQPLQTQVAGHKNGSAHWVYTVLLRDADERDRVLKALNDEGIMAGLVHVPNDAYTAFESSKDDLPGVRDFSSRQFSLPCGWWLSDEDIHHIHGRLMHHVGSK